MKPGPRTKSGKQRCRQSSRRLTDDQRELVLRWIAEGHSDTEIEGLAEKQGFQIRRQTVKYHREAESNAERLTALEDEVALEKEVAVEANPILDPNWRLRELYELYLIAKADGDIRCAREILATVDKMSGDEDMDDETIGAMFRRFLNMPAETPKKEDLPPVFTLVGSEDDGTEEDD